MGTKADDRARAEELRRCIAKYNAAYYAGAQSLVSDYDYDLLLAELQQLERLHPELVTPESPTQHVGDDRLGGFGKVRHRVPMRSLDNTYSLEELRDFDRRVRGALGHAPEYSVELKYDGLAVSLVYVRGRLVLAATRGNGAEGDDVTPTALRIVNLPHALQGGGFPARLEVRGEVFVPRATFENLNRARAEQGLEAYANPRNLASGTLKLRTDYTPELRAKAQEIEMRSSQASPEERECLADELQATTARYIRKQEQALEEVERRGMHVALYYVVADVPLAPTHAHSLEMAREWGLPVIPNLQVCGSIDQVFHVIQEWGTLRDGLPFETDGVVVKVNSYADQLKLGETARSPRWAIAYKYPSRQQRSRLVGVEFQVGRTGAITPVAVVEPVQLGGSTVQRASLYNADELLRLDLHQGDTVLLEKGGEVIPKIVGVDPALRPLGAQPVVFPSRCPDCGAELVRNPGEARHRCPNAQACPQQMRGAILHFASKPAMGIMSLGEETVRQLFARGLVRHPLDLYSLTPDLLADLDGFKEKSIANLLGEIERSRQQPFRALLFALGIPLVGEQTARGLAAAFGTLERLAQASVEELTAVEDVGGVVAAQVYAYFHRPEFERELQRIQALGLGTAEEVSAPTSSRLLGERIVISGTFSQYSRDELKALVETHGGRLQAAVSSTTTRLIAGARMGASKLRRAQELGIPILSESEFINLISS